MTKPTPDLIIDDELETAVELETDDENLPADTITKKELNPGQKAVAIRRRIEEYLELKHLRENYGIDVLENEIEE